MKTFIWEFQNIRSFLQVGDRRLTPYVSQRWPCADRRRGLIIGRRPCRAGTVFDFWVYLDTIPKSMQNASKNGPKGQYFTYSWGLGLGRVVFPGSVLHARLTKGTVICQVGNVLKGYRLRGCFCKCWVLFVSVQIIRALFGVYVWAPDSWKLPHVRC